MKMGITVISFVPFLRLMRSFILQKLDVMTVLAILRMVTPGLSARLVSFCLLDRTSSVV